VKHQPPHRGGEALASSRIVWGAPGDRRPFRTARRATGPPQRISGSPPRASLYAIVGLALPLLAVAAGPRAAQPQRQEGPEAQRNEKPILDLRINGGRVMDGTGNPWFAADVGVRDGRIAAVGRLDDAPARRVIDAKGKIVAPGFIDVHSHAAEGLLSKDVKRRQAANLVTQGATTVVVNPDGASTHPLPEQKRRFQRLAFAPNVILMVGHNSVRRAVLKDDYRRAATPAEVAEMRRRVREEMRAGAFGLTAGLEYSPGIWSTTEELIALVEEIVPFDGAFIVHERSSGADPFWYFPSQHPNPHTSMIDNILELIEISERTGAKVVATHIKARGAHFWGSSSVMIQLIERARARGVRIYADQYPYNSTGSDGHLVLIPGWAFANMGGQGGNNRAPVDYAARLEQRLKDEQTARDLRRDIAHVITRRGGAENIIVMDHPDKRCVGRSLGQLAELQKMTSVEMAIQLQRGGYRSRPGGARLRSYSLSELDVEAFASQPWTATASDAGVALPKDGPVHARFYGTFPRKIRHYAITRGLLSVEDAVRSSTSLPAQILGIRDRGQVREGFHADLVVFDLERIRDKATFDNPHQYSEGIEQVLIGGVAVVEDGAPTGALPGVLVMPVSPQAVRGG
jgi:N-acyl-D-amino-acid deacylase